MYFFYSRKFDEDDDDDRRHHKKDGDDDETEDYWFVARKWFAKGEDDGKIVRELLPTDEHGNKLDTGLQGTGMFMDMAEAESCGADIVQLIEKLILLLVT